MTRTRAVALVCLVTMGAVAWLRLGPLPEGLLREQALPSTVVLDRHGAVLYEARATDGGRSIGIAPDKLPDVLLDATLAAEDHRFWSHPGVDPIAVFRAIAANVRAGHIVEGGSTITQQVAKLLLARQGGASPGWRAKAREALVALRLEQRLSKREIAALYLTLAPYGNQIAGAERASRAYFGRGASDLTAAQAAFLAALPQRPTAFNPWRDAARARPRQRAILERMRALGLLTREDFAHAIAERVAPVRADAQMPAPHFVEKVLSSFRGARPARIETTLDLELQHSVRGIVDARREELRRHGASHVAVVVLDNRTAEWLAWEGSGDYLDPHGGAIDGAQTPRQPGSAVKPFTYALAFDEGLSPATALPDIPSHFPTADPGVFYSPRNYDGVYRGPMLARAALAGSENVPAVAVLSRVGVPSLLRLLRRAGLTTLDKTAPFYGLGLTLGNAEVRLDELVAAYSSFPRGGRVALPTFLKSAVAAGTSERVISARAAYWVSDILADADAREYAFGRGGSLEFPFPVAAKTGTSQGYHDNWAIGFTREVTVGVWVGNFDRTPLRNSSGVTGAGPIFHAAMLAAMERVAPASAIAAGGDAFDIVPPPADVERRRICLLSGMAANEWCPRERSESLPREAAALPCSWHHQSDEGVLTVWPAEYRHWAGERGLLRASLRPAPTRERPRPVRRIPSRGTQTLTIVNPPPGAIYLIDPTLRREFQALPLRATGATGDLWWEVNGRPVGSAAAESGLDWPLAPGRHQVEVADARGRRARTTVIVR